MAAPGGGANGQRELYGGNVLWPRRGVREYPGVERPRRPQPLVEIADKVRSPEGATPSVGSRLRGCGTGVGSGSRGSAKPPPLAIPGDPFGVSTTARRLTIRCHFPPGGTCFVSQSN